MSATLEESLATGEHAHAHVYIHFGKDFRAKGRGALDPFVFEGIHPHVVPNKANGGNWLTIECSSTDNNTNWGANGQAPQADWKFGSCYVNCACNN